MIARTAERGCLLDRDALGVMNGFTMTAVATLSRGFFEHGVFYHAQSNLVNPQKCATIPP